MAQAFKEFTFKLSGDSADLSTKLDKVMQTFKQIGGTVDVLNSKMDKAGTGMESTLKVSLSQAKELKQIFSQLGYSGFLGSKLDRAVFLDSIQGIKDFKKDRLQIERQMLTEALEMNKKYDADLKALHKQQGESLLLQYNKTTADAKEAHRRRGEAIARQYAKDNEAAKAALKVQEEAHRRQGEILMQQWKAQGEAHTRLGETLMRNYLRDSAAAKEEHRRRGEIIAQAYAQQNAADRAAEQTRLSQFSTFLKDREALLRADINTQRQIEISGLNSIEAHRARANQQRLTEEQRYRAQIRAIDANVKAGGSSALGQTQATAAMTAYLAALKLVDAQLAVHEKAVQHADTAHHSMWLRVAAVTTIYNIWTTAAHRTYQALMSVPTTGIQYEGTKASLLAITKSTAGVSSEMTFLRNEAHRTGLSLDGLRSSFRVFAASALTSGEDIKTVEGIFKNINTMATTLHMSVDDVNGVFLALSQIFNKGKLQAEELVKQLAQRIPGSVTMMAKAYAKAGESIQSATQRLLKDMKSGSVAAHENIAKFAEVLGTDFGGEAFKVASTGLNAELGKLSTSWTELTENIYKGSERSIGGLVGMGRSWVEFARDSTANTFELTQNFTQLGHTVSLFGQALAGLAVGALLGYITNVIRAGEVTLVLTTLIKANPYVLAASALGVLAVGMTAYGEATRRAAEAEKERLALTKQLADERIVKAPEVKIEEDRAKRVKDSDSVRPFKDRYETDRRDFEKLRADYYKLNEDLAKNKATPFGQAKASGKSDAMLLAALEDIKPKLEEARVNAFNSTRKYNEQYDKEYKAALAQEELAGYNESTLVVNKPKEALEVARVALEERKAAFALEKEERDLRIQTLKGELELAQNKDKLSAKSVSLQKEIKVLSEESANKSIQAAQEIARLTVLTKNSAREVSYDTMSKDAVRLSQVIKSLESSNADPFRPSATGAIGRYQMMPRTYERFKEKSSPSASQFFGASQSAKAAYDRGSSSYKANLSAQSIKDMREFGERQDGHMYQAHINMLKFLIKKYEGSPDVMLKAMAGYNAGEGNVDKAVRQAAKTGGDWKTKLPGETRKYIRDGAPRLLKNEGDSNAYYAAQSNKEVDSANLDIAKAVAAKQQLQVETQKELDTLEKQRQAAVEKNALTNEGLQLEINTVTQNQLALDLAKITLDANKKEVELAKDKNFAGIELLKIQTTQARAQATLADAERKVARDSEFASIRENELSLRKLSGMVTEKQYLEELQKIKESQLPSLEEQLKLTEKITKEEDRQLAVLRIKEQMRAIREPNRGAGAQYLDQQGAAVDPTDTRGFLSREATLAQGQQTDLAGLTQPGQMDKDGQLQTLETYLQQKNAMESKYTDANFINQSKYYAGIAGVGAETFKGITSHMIAMYGAQSKEARRAFIAYKAFMVAQTIMNTAAGVVAQLTNPTPYVGIALAAVAAAMGAIQVAKIIAEPMPQAHGGLEYVPEDATYKLSKGERVLAPRQNEAFMKLNRDLSAQMQRGNQGIGNPSSNSKPTIVKPQIRVVNVDYSSQELSSLLQSSAGEEIVVNHMVRNKESLA